MDEIDIEHRLTEVESRSKSNTKRIDNMEPIVNEIHTMSNTMVKLVNEVKHTNETVNNMEKKLEKIDSRVDDMERAPGDDAKKYKTTAITAIISTIAGAFSAGIIMLIAQYI